MRVRVVWRVKMDELVLSTTIANVHRVSIEDTLRQQEAKMYRGGTVVDRMDGG